MNPNLSDGTNTELKFCEFCGSPLFDYSNVCKQCGKEQPKREPVKNTAGNSVTNNSGVPANPGYTIANNSGTPANSGYTSANTSGTPTNPGYTLANNSGTPVNSGYTSADIQHRFCEKCGSTLDSQTGKCPKCSDQVSIVNDNKTAKKSGGSKFPIVGFAICASLLLVAVVVIVVLGIKTSYYKNNTEKFYNQAIYYRDLVADAQYDAERADELSAELDSVIREKNELQSEYDALNDEYQNLYTSYTNASEDLEIANFAKQFVVVCFDNNTNKYHRLDCPDFDSLCDKYSFWAYNIGAAKEKYTACSKCN